MSAKAGVFLPAGVWPRQHGPQIRPHHGKPAPDIHEDTARRRSAVPHPEHDGEPAECAAAAGLRLSASAQLAGGRHLRLLLQGRIVFILLCNPFVKSSPCLHCYCLPSRNTLEMCSYYFLYVLDNVRPWAAFLSFDVPLRSTRVSKEYLTKEDSPTTSVSQTLPYRLP